MERLQWKRELIATVDARLAAAPVAPPAAAEWSVDDAYMRVTVQGIFQHDRETLVQALTEQGAGFWVLTPLDTDAGIVFVNRGFVPADRRGVATRTAGQVTGSVTVSGLLRASEPDGGFLRANAPQDERWYSRDVEAMAAARGLEGQVAPYFIDADATPNPSGYPVGGLTVLRFRNSHLTYALTWFGLCLLSLVGMGLVWRTRHGSAPA